jgi:carbonic anhydrase
MPYSRPPSPDAAIERLLAGNQRYIDEHPQAPVSSAARIELASGQQPFAVVIGCSDSRVPVETIFDQAPGNLFVVRVAGHVLSDEVLASAEYGVAVLGAMVVLVLGHSECGAVGATLDYLSSGKVFPGHIGRLVESIAPVIRGSASLGPAVRANARAGAEALHERSSLLRDALQNGTIRIAAATYDLHDGRVELLARSAV